MARRGSEGSDLKARGYVYSLVWEREPGERFTVHELRRTAIDRWGGIRKIAQRIETLLDKDTIRNALHTLARASIVRREGRDPETTRYVWVRQRMPIRFPEGLLKVRGCGTREAEALLGALVTDRHLELRQDGLYHDTREAS